MTPAASRSQCKVAGSVEIRVGHQPQVGIVAAAGKALRAGRIEAEALRDAILAVRPYAVDVASGVESGPGIKDLLKLRAFMDAVRGNGT